MFDDADTEWAPTRARLRTLLTADEWSAARRTTLNAHYTDPTVVAAVWDFLAAVGFDGGRVLEPGCGSGNFIGLAPADLDVSWIGVELDPTTAAICALLYPQATIRAEGFETTDLPDGSVDAVVGNVPFGKVALYDRRHNAAGESIHNHFIIKALHLCRPGGMVAVLTSRYTMDARNPQARATMADLADLVTAVRLPGSTHRHVAGTDVVTDLLVLRRRPPDAVAGRCRTVAPDRGPRHRRWAGAGQRVVRRPSRTDPRHPHARRRLPRRRPAASPAPSTPPSCTPSWQPKRPPPSPAATATTPLRHHRRHPGRSRRPTSTLPPAASRAPSSNCRTAASSGSPAAGPRRSTARSAPAES